MRPLLQRLKMNIVKDQYKFICQNVSAIGILTENEEVQAMFTNEELAEYVQDDVLLLKFLRKFLHERGSSGEFENHKFLYTLDKSINEFLSSNRSIYGRYLSNSDVIKLVLAIKFMLVRSVIKDDRFVPLDVQVLLQKSFVDRRENSENSNVWRRLGQLVNVQVEDNVQKILHLSRIARSALLNIQYYERNFKDSDNLYKVFITLESKIEKIIFMIAHTNDVSKFRRRLLEKKHTNFLEFYPLLQSNSPHDILRFFSKCKKAYINHLKAMSTTDLDDTFTVIEQQTAIEGNEATKKRKSQGDNEALFSVDENIHESTFETAAIDEEHSDLGLNEGFFEEEFEGGDFL